MKPILFVIAWFSLAATASFGQSSSASYLDPNLSAERRAADLVARMTLEEKVLQMQNRAPAVPRLGIVAYNWWNEALHGVAQGRATVFPQAIGLAATWDTDLMHSVADTISTEARAKYNDSLLHPAQDASESPGTFPGRTAGLTYWSPNISSATPAGDAGRKPTVKIPISPPASAPRSLQVCSETILIT